MTLGDDRVHRNHLTLDDGRGLIGYKLTTNARRSWYWNLPEIDRVQYRINDWAVWRDRCGALAVFESIEALRAFIGTIDDDTMLWKCRYIPCDSLWHQELYTSTMVYDPSIVIPWGTIFADAVRLIRPLS